VLAVFPYAAPVEPLLSGEETVFRSLTVARGLYKVIYFIENPDVVIARLWDCRQNPDKLSVH
jgi:hypothetical protein